MLEILSIPLLIVSNLLFASRRLYQYLRFLQQEEYDGPRFVRWVLEYRFFDSRGSAVLVAALIASFLLPRHGMAMSAVLIAACVLFPVVAFVEPDPRKAGKIKLNMTERARRIFRIAFSTYVLAAILVPVLLLRLPIGSVYLRLLLGHLIVIQAMPLFLVFAVRALAGGERKLQQRFIAEARSRLAEVDPFVIGITGSFGKTSTKAVLGKMLDLALGSTFWPQKGINTEMGITRALREELQDSHRYAVIEMGAYRPGSIAKLCKLTPPKAAIVTAVGLMHLERMGGAEQVLLAKSELPQHVPDDGILVCNGDNAGAREIARRHPKKTTLLYGLKPELGGLSCWASDVRFSPEGSHFKIHWDSRVLDAFTPLHGRPALSNILASFTMAATLGADPEYLLAAVRGLEPVNNRLAVQTVGQGLQINDAYNSNPEGFAAALEVLQDLPGDRKILITPGMIELGDQQDEENRRVARLAGGICDLVFVVGLFNKTALLEGLTEAGLKLDESIRCFDTRDQALAVLQQERGARDVVLLENDLPDLYELDIRL
jgi:UDP-N-acetylmuramoyl-tripeptide--D-alanyl-D-alanine ligase